MPAQPWLNGPPRAEPLHPRAEHRLPPGPPPQCLPQHPVSALRPFLSWGARGGMRPREMPGRKVGPGQQLPFLIFRSSGQQSVYWDLEGAALAPRTGGPHSPAQLEGSPPVSIVWLVIAPALLECPRHAPAPIATFLCLWAQTQLLWQGRVRPHPHHLFRVQGVYVLPSLSLLGGRGCLGPHVHPRGAHVLISLTVRGQVWVPMSTPLSLLGAGGCPCPRAHLGSQGVLVAPYPLGYRGCP